MLKGFQESAPDTKLDLSASQVTPAPRQDRGLLVDTIRTAAGWIDPDHWIDREQVTLLIPPCTISGVLL
jgi:hypothetical protein